LLIGCTGAIKKFCVVALLFMLLFCVEFESFWLFVYASFFSFHLQVRLSRSDAPLDASTDSPLAGGAVIHPPNLPPRTNRHDKHHQNITTSQLTRHPSQTTRHKPPHHMPRQNSHACHNSACIMAPCPDFPATPLDH